MVIGWEALREDPSILQTGDILHQRSTSFISRQIRRFSTTKGERETFPSHTAMLLDVELRHPTLRGTGRTTVIEAQHKTNVNPLWDYDNDSSQAIITRVPGLTDAQRRALYLAALEYVGKPYPYAKLGLHLLDWLLFNGKYVIRRMAFSGSEYCTALVLRIYRDAGIPLAPYDLDEITPDDLLDYALTLQYGTNPNHDIVWVSSEETLELINRIYQKVTV